MTAPSSQPDPVSLVLRALPFGVAVGVGCQALVTFGVDLLKAGLPPTAKPSLTSAHALLLLLGTPAGMVLAGFATWSILAPIRNSWRQAMLGSIAGLGSFVLSVLAIWPIYGYFGRPGLLGLAAVAALACLLIARRPSAAGAPT